MALLATDLEGIQLRPLGTFRVRDFKQPEVLYQVHALGLPTRFRAPMSLDTAVPPIAAVVALDVHGARDRAEAIDLPGVGAEQSRLVRFLRRRFDAANGRFIKFSGDGCFAAFDSPTVALHFLQEVAERVGAAGYDLWASLHVGPVEVVDSQPVGATVLITHELMREAEPDSVLISRSASDVLRSSGVEADVGPVVSLPSIRGRLRTYTWPLARPLSRP